MIMIIQIEVTNEEVAFIGHLLDLADKELSSETLRLAPGFLTQYAEDILHRLDDKWALGLFTDEDLALLLNLWPILYETPVPTIEELRGSTVGVDSSNLDN